MNVPQVNRLFERHSEYIDLGPCVVGQNLNLATLRGFSTLDVLAEISAPDIFDQVDNPTGTQRDLKSKHAQECFSYAMDSIALAPEESPRYFPEIILNARDASVIEIYNLDDVDELYELDSFSSLESVPYTYVGLRIRVGNLEWPKKTKSPQISRVDGNHRLWEADTLLDEYELHPENVGDGTSLPEFPLVSFSMLLGLSPIQEAMLFRDINGEHEGMETAHLDSMAYRIGNEEAMKGDPQELPLWLAHKLTESGRAFEGMVFMGGAKTGIKKLTGAVPPIKINSLKSAIKVTLKAAPIATLALESKPDGLLEILDRYWKAVRKTFPDAWQNKQDYILLQSIGLVGFSKFGGIVIDEAWGDSKVQPENFESFVKSTSNVSLVRTDYPGIAGAGGAEYIAEILLRAFGPEEVTRIKNLEDLGVAGADPSQLNT